MTRPTRGAALFLALALCLTLPGCGGPRPEAEATPSPAPTEQPSPSPAAEAEEDSLTVSLGDAPASIDPAAVASREEMALLSHLFEGLMKWAPSGRAAAEGVEYAQVVPGMAERYEKTALDDGGVTYTFHLRPAKWSDGKPVTAHDFVYAWQRLLSAGSAAPYGELLDAVRGAQDVAQGLAQPSDLALRAVDDGTFEVTLDWDVPWFLELCALPIAAPLRQDKVEEGGSQWTYGPDTYITNGPYKISAWESAYLAAERDPAYYDPDLPGPRALVFAFRGDDADGQSAYDAGAVDFLQGVEADGAGRLPYLASYYLIFQTQQAPFDDLRVRQALSLAIDREKLTAEQAPGQTPAGSLVPAGTLGADGASGPDYRARAGESLDPSAQGYSDNLQKAQALLAQAGYPGGAGFPAVTYLCPDNAAHRAVGEALCQMWQEALGIPVTVESVGWGEFLERCHRGEFTLARGRWVADYNDPLAFLQLWRAQGEGNDAKYQEPQFDELLDRAAQASDPSLRMDLLAQAEDLLIGRDHALAPLYYETLPYQKPDGLRGVFYSPLGYFFFTRAER